DLDCASQQLFVLHRTHGQRWRNTLLSALNRKMKFSENNLKDSGSIWRKGHDCRLPGEGIEDRKRHTQRPAVETRSQRGSEESSLAGNHPRQGPSRRRLSASRSAI